MGPGPRERVTQAGVRPGVGALGAWGRETPRATVVSPLRGLRSTGWAWGRETPRAAVVSPLRGLGTWRKEIPRAAGVSPLRGLRSTGQAWGCRVPPSYMRTQPWEFPSDFFPQGP